MSAHQYIIDHKLPITQDFKSLRKEGLDYIQEYIGDEWTNMNASDPGVTILDQVCYALTELGYCNDFPVKDILTRPNKKLEVKDQFYLPENILTTSPVTVPDYIKYIVDGIGEVKNAVIVPATSSLSSGSDTYQVYLLIDPPVTDRNVIRSIRTATFNYLNKCRNIGELFLVPKEFKKVTYSLWGSVEIANKTERDTVIAAIDNAIRNYIFPPVVQAGYQQLTQDGLDINEIFNGPLLQHGWIPAANLHGKQDQLSIIKVTELVTTVSGVKSVSNLMFISPAIDNPNLVKSQPDELLVIDLSELNITWPGSTSLTDTKPGAQVVKPPLVKGNIQLGASVKEQTDVPVGKYRDINSYYSIQNTFPEIFAVGADAITSDAAGYQVAQSRQLKGYLTLFDQVLANQFSQLANIDKLFSFKNSLTGTPSDEKEFYAVKDAFEKEHPEYPAPYQVFSPTYFYQSLYDVPHIRPLLKDNDTFNFSFGIESERELEHKSWLEYKGDPYNPYMRGLMEFIEEDSESLARRNNILDHLLARHGESPLLMDMIIEGSVYAGGSMKDRVIFKSLYLQNLGLLSYFRQKAYDYQGAGPVLNNPADVPPKLDQDILGGDQHDFIFNSDRINRVEKLTGQDFIDYSAFELKLSLLFGLKPHYRDFLVSKIDKNTGKIDRGEHQKLALWMITQRRGMIFIEMDLLLQNAAFEVIIADGTGVDPIYSVPFKSYWKISESLKYEELIAIAQTFKNNDNAGLNGELQQGAFNIGDSEYKLESRPSLEGNFKKIACTDYYFVVWVHFKNGMSFENYPVFDNRTLVIFPDFIPQLNTVPFRNRLKLFIGDMLPVQVTCGYNFAGAVDLKNLVHAFANWHNAMMYRENSEIAHGELRSHAGTLAKLLNNINAETND